MGRHGTRDLPAATGLAALLLSRRGMKNLTFATLLLVLVGCASQPLPMKLQTPERALLEATHFDAVVAVDPEWEGYARRLRDALRDTGLFDRVEMRDDLDVEPDLVARVTRPVYGTASILPLLTVVTLGIVPTWGDEEWGDAFELTSAHGAESVEVDFSYERPTILGWVALVANVSPNRQAGNPRNSTRFKEAFAHEIAARASDIERLLAEP